MFKALADPTRRSLLDELFRADGQTLTQLEARLPMTRFGVMKHLKQLEEAGLVFSSLSPDGHLVEFAELAGHPFFVGTQAHPEFLSRPTRPHPLFGGLIAAALAHSRSAGTVAARAAATA